MLAQIGPSRSVENWLSSIDEIDLSMIRMKLADTEEGKGWSTDYSTSVEAEYRRYLALSAAYPDKAIVPSKSLMSSGTSTSWIPKPTWKTARKSSGRFCTTSPISGCVGRRMLSLSVMPMTRR